MAIGMSDVTLITARIMAPEFKKQVDHYKQLLRRYKLQWSRESERPVGSIGYMLISNAEASTLLITYFHAQKRLMLAEMDLKRCEEVIARAEHANQSKSVQDAEAMVPDQGQSEGAPVSKREGETLPDPDQGTDT